MAKIDLLDQKWIDLVFEGKNEAYGAYQIRKDTNHRNLLALLFLLAGIAAIVAFFLLYGVAKSALTPDVDVDQSVEVQATEVDEAEDEEEEVEVIYEEPEPEMEQVLQEELVNSERFTDLAMDDEKPQEVAKTNEEAAKGEFTTGTQDFSEGSEEGTKVKTEEMQIVEEKHEEDNAVYEINMIEQMPRFPGDPGDNSVLMQYLGKNINYPSVAEENGDQGRVVCTFVVEKDGSISDVKVVRGVTPALDKEAVRVIKSMPKWQPGKQNGHSVRVKFTLPVTFKLQ
jgi:protein TonB